MFWNFVSVVTLIVGCVIGYGVIEMNRRLTVLVSLVRVLIAMATPHTTVIEDVIDPEKTTDREYKKP